jgi:hypothetical protein
MISYRFRSTAGAQKLPQAALLFSRASAFVSCSSTVTLGFAGAA